MASFVFDYVSPRRPSFCHVCVRAVRRFRRRSPCAARVSAWVCVRSFAPFAATSQPLPYRAAVAAAHEPAMLRPPSVVRRRLSVCRCVVCAVCSELCPARSECRSPLRRRRSFCHVRVRAVRRFRRCRPCAARVRARVCVRSFAPFTATSQPLPYRAAVAAAREPAMLSPPSVVRRRSSVRRCVVCAVCSELCPVRSECRSPLRRRRSFCHVHVRAVRRFRRRRPCAARVLARVWVRSFAPFTLTFRLS